MAALLATAGWLGLLLAAEVVARWLLPEDPPYPGPLEP
jgi:hypothetical protein